ncbi:MAG: ribosomal subunit interface protein [Deltaproteobacteria bacterium RIFCSPLOWO2_12_FULL_43_16]|nr:MAG: ribosomal subunit interface protein [Deltaproteobacteria bacterium GWA2_43_19]OGQ24312.1 MAG: ribosomal subunit interface protein [Deltaproteobacteria bacterium RIFCSPHIGHO2_02_FULL_42_44]OGQ35165.1 MAG: ribosomal subunit interface protein [Deltaproteobacteria bacterium RIFCSPLOWO2_01_FULL_42_9]OGQ59290.1 MAG: ribosomal subunit interface protein [Deltaproteobacteria bacterium RIFCSPLOWO2_12_FULL_43_16]HBR16160.1 ribosome-associated translation inhibitor RaiA [Deltaproteobacteria bacteri
MKIDLQITGRNFEITDIIKDNIQERAEKLDSFYSHIMRCRVVVEVPHRHKHKGMLYDVRIYMTVSGGEIIIKHEPNEDIYVAIRDAFDAARRKLEDYGRKQRGDTKQHEEIPHARISKIFPDKGYGFLTTADGREIYFHENSVLNKDLKNLQIGTEVHFAEEQGEKGPQASTVRVVGK